MIQHSKPTIGKKEKLKEFIEDILNSQQYAEGKYVKIFEEKLSNFFSTKYAVVVSSGTAALHLALLSLGVDNNSEVILPSFSCFALLNAVLYTGAKPVIVDINHDEFNISYDEVKKNISKKTKAIIIPHMFGYPAKDTKKIINLGIPVIEDTAQSIGAKIDNVLVGKFGVINVLSFYATKMITTFGEGGAVLTNNEKLYKKIVDLKSYDKKFDFKLRFNYKLTEIQAVMGILQLEEINEFILKRKKIFEIYKNGLKNCSIKIFEPQDNIEPIFYRFIIQFNKKIDLEKVVEKFKKLEIEVAKPVFLPLDKYFYGKFLCKNSKRFYETTLSLPIYPEIKEYQIKKIASYVRKILGIKRKTV